MQIIKKSKAIREMNKQIVDVIEKNKLLKFVDEKEIDSDIELLNFKQLDVQALKKLVKNYFYSFVLIELYCAQIVDYKTLYLISKSFVFKNVIKINHLVLE